jgi:hypothetical protein
MLVPCSGNSSKISYCNKQQGGINFNIFLSHFPAQRERESVKTVPDVSYQAAHNYLLIVDRLYYKILD